MAKKFVVNLTHNKNNGQFNISIPKKKIGKKNLFNLKKSKQIKITIEGFE